MADHASRITHHASRPRVACFTPLPPIQSGIAQYSAEVLPLLGQAVELDVYVDGYRPTVGVPGARVLPAKGFERAHRARPYEVIIYQMGNSPAHAYMWPLVRRYPGLLVLHDYVLHHLHVWLAVNRRMVGFYQGEMTARYGAAGADVARKTLRGQMPGSVFDYPLCEGLVEASRAVAVHNAYAAGLVAERCGRADIERIPMGMPLYRLPERGAARRRLGLPEGAPVVASLGEMSPHKRLDVILRALLRVRERQPGLVYVVAGKESPGLNLDRQVRMLGLEGSVRRLGYIAEATAPDLLAAADLVVNLRYPTAGETSASLLRILAAGQAVIVTRAGSMAELPPDACAMIAADAVEEELLAETIALLLADEPLRRRMAANARAFIEREHTLPASARAYLRVLGRMLGREPPAPDWSPVVVDARAGGPALAEASAEPVATPPDPLADAVAEAIVDLRLDRAPGLAPAVAAALADLNLAPHQRREA
jgi:glycosyltransferase involved in cell wall biosynthesis